MINELIAYLQSNTISFKTISYSWEMQPFDDPLNNSPALLVFHGDDDSLPSNLDNCISQESFVEVGIFIISTHAEMDALKTELRAAVLGWQYNVNHTGMEHKKGSLQNITAKYIWWLDTFTTTTNLRGT